MRPGGPTALAVSSRTGRQGAAQFALAAAVLTLLGLIVAACGVGIGAGESTGTAHLLVSRDFGETKLVDVAGEELRESDTVMRVLDRNAEIETRYGGGFVQGINGLEGGNEGGRPYDWLFFVNGIESDRGGADYVLSDGDRIWWDYRDWGATMRVPAVVGQFPEPFVNGFEGASPTTVVDCRADGEVCEGVAQTLAKAGAKLATEAEDATRLLVGTWQALAADRDVAAFARGPLRSGVYLEIVAGDDHDSAGIELVALDQRGEERARYGSGYGFIAATRRGERPPTWVIAGVDDEGLAAAAAAFNADDMAGHFAVLVGPEGAVPLPAR